jgi:hypothetical protein
MESVELSFKPSELAVGIGFPTGQFVCARTMLSLVQATQACAARRIPTSLLAIIGSSLVTYARNRVVQSFLDTDCQYLFWIDSDIHFTSDDFLRVLLLTVDCGVVCAAYPLKTEQEQFIIKHPDLRTYAVNKYGLVKVDGVGLGFCCMKREIVEQVVATKPTLWDAVHQVEIADVFRLDTIVDADGRRCGRGEDMAFFQDIQDLGHSVWLDPKITLGHVGERVYTGDVAVALGLAGHLPD